jgi:hypothetical protein
MTVLAARAWVAILPAGAALLFGGLVQLTADRPVASGLLFVQGNMAVRWDALVALDPEAATAILGFQRMLAVFIIGFALLDLSVLLTAYRRGERWAWLAMWLNLAVLGGVVAVATAFDGWGSPSERDAAVRALAVLIGLVLVGLLLPIRTFFPDGETRATASRSRTG